MAIHLIADGSANRQIADRLSVTEDTVKGAWRISTRESIARMGTHESLEPANLAVRLGALPERVGCPRGRKAVDMRPSVPSDGIAVVRGTSVSKAPSITALKSGRD